MCTHKVGVTGLDQVDNELIGWLGLRAGLTRPKTCFGAEYCSPGVNRPRQNGIFEVFCRFQVVPMVAGWTRAPSSKPGRAIPIGTGSSFTSVVIRAGMPSTATSRSLRSWRLA